MTDPRPVCLWSGPRNVSTALMYSFRELPSVAVVDEPLYGHYLSVTGAEHPGREAVIAAMNCDGGDVMRKLLQRQRETPASRLFVKHMAHHLVDIDTSFVKDTVNLFLIRDPKEMLPSLTIQVPHAGLADTGLKRQCELYDELVEFGQNPPVLDSRELLLNPAAVLSQLCGRIGIEYSDTMLDWEPGPRDEDGVWAPHWYHAVHQSTGFSEYRAKDEFPEHLEALLEECAPWYARLYEHAIRADGE